MPPLEEHEELTTPAPHGARHARSRADRGGKLLSVQAAVEFLGLPYKTLRRAALTGKIPYVQIPGQRRMWFERKDLERALEVWKNRR